MIYTFDTEFCEDHGAIDLISIGIVAEDGREFYAVSTEARLDRVGAWHREHVLPQLPDYGDKAWMSRLEMRKQISLFTGGVVWPSGLETPADDDYVTKGVEPPVPDSKPIFWAWYGASDWVALYQLWGRLLDAPKRFPKWCRELKRLSAEVGDPQLPPKPKDAHNALVDARWNRSVYSFLMAYKPGTPRSQEVR